MDFESKYNELAEAVRAVVESNPGLCKIDEGLGRLSKLLPENESENDRIRKFLLDYFVFYKNHPALYVTPNKWQGINTSDIIAYLEKQKEQKPNIELIQKSWYLEGFHDGKYNNEPKWLIQTCEGGPRYEENPKYGTQQPAEWSEEDEKVYEYLKNGFEYATNNPQLLASHLWGENDATIQDYKDFVDKLKSLRHQPHWKPSEEQMEALNSIILNGSFTYVGQVQDLISLKDELKKLM